MARTAAATAGPDDCRQIPGTGECLARTLAELRACLPPSKTVTTAQVEARGDKGSTGRCQLSPAATVLWERDTSDPRGERVALELQRASSWCARYAVGRAREGGKAGREVQVQTRVGTVQLVQGDQRAGGGPSLTCAPPESQFLEPVPASSGPARTCWKAFDATVSASADGLSFQLGSDANASIRCKAGKPTPPPPLPAPAVEDKSAASPGQGEDQSIELSTDPDKGPPPRMTTKKEGKKVTVSEDGKEKGYFEVEE